MQPSTPQRTIRPGTRIADMDRLFRDWRYALLWVVGISALAAAYFARGGGHEDLMAQPQAAVPTSQPVAGSSPAPAPAPAADAGEEATKFGEPVMDTTPFEPSPAEPNEAASAAATPASASEPEAQ